MADDSVEWQSVNGKKKKNRSRQQQQHHHHQNGWHKSGSGGSGGGGGGGKRQYYSNRNKQHSMKQQSSNNKNKGSVRQAVGSSQHQQQQQSQPPPPQQQQQQQQQSQPTRAVPIPSGASSVPVMAWKKAVVGDTVVRPPASIVAGTSGAHPSTQPQPPPQQQQQVQQPSGQSGKKSGSPRAVSTSNSNSNGNKKKSSKPKKKKSNAKSSPSPSPPPQQQQQPPQQQQQTQTQPSQQQSTDSASTTVESKPSSAEQQQLVAASETPLSDDVAVRKESPPPPTKDDDDDAVVVVKAAAVDGPPSRVEMPQFPEWSLDDLLTVPKQIPEETPDVAVTNAENPYMLQLQKRLRAIRKKLEKIARFEQVVASGGTLHEEQKTTMSQKAAMTQSLYELEKLQKLLQPVANDERKQRMVKEEESRLLWEREFVEKVNEKFGSVSKAWKDEVACALEEQQAVLAHSHDEKTRKVQSEYEKASKRDLQLANERIEELRANLDSVSQELVLEKQKNDQSMSTAHEQISELQCTVNTKEDEVATLKAALAQKDAAIDQVALDKVDEALRSVMSLIQVSNAFLFGRSRYPMQAMQMLFNELSEKKIVLSDTHLSAFVHMRNVVLGEVPYYGKTAVDTGVNELHALLTGSEDPIDQFDLSYGELRDMISSIANTNAFSSMQQFQPRPSMPGAGYYGYPPHDYEYQNFGGAPPASNMYMQFPPGTYAQQAPRAFNSPVPPPQQQQQQQQPPMQQQPPQPPPQSVDDDLEQQPPQQPPHHHAPHPQQQQQPPVGYQMNPVFPSVAAGAPPQQFSRASVPNDYNFQQDMIRGGVRKSYAQRGPRGSRGFRKQQPQQQKDLSQKN